MIGLRKQCNIIGKSLGSLHRKDTPISIKRTGNGPQASPEGAD
jgi:hypothetical protein